MKTQRRNMLQGPLLPSIIVYTIPIMLTGLLQLLFNATDLVVVGRFCGSVSVAAVGATGSLTGLVVNLFIGLSVGTGVTVAHGLGSRENTVVHRTVHTALPAALVSGLILTVIGICFSTPMLELMGTPENVLPLSSIYMKIYFAGITFTMVFNFCASILRAAGDTRSPLIFLTIAGVINVILNLVFVTLLDMNVAGVALATTIAQAVSAVLVVIRLTRRADACKLELRKIKFYKPQLLRIIRIGLPAGIQNSLFAISNITIQSSINSFGDIVMTGNAAAANIEGFVYVSMSAFQQTAVNFTGQNVGAHQYDRVKKILWTCLGCVLVTGLTVSLSAYCFRHQLLSIYITDSAEAISYGALRMSIVCFTYYLCGLLDVSTGALRGLGASIAPMLISILGICVFRVGWVYTVFQLPQFHTPQSLYLSYPISWSVTFLIQFFVFFRVYKKHLKNTSIAAT